MVPTAVRLLPGSGARSRRRAASWTASAADELRSTLGAERVDEVLVDLGRRLAPALRQLGHDAAILDDAAFAGGLLYALSFVAYQEDLTGRASRVRAYCDVTASLAVFDALLVGLAAHLGVDEVEAALRLADADPSGTWREPVLAAGHRLLAAGRSAEAADCARRALQTMSACPVSQRLLLDATGTRVDLSDRFCGRPFEVLVSGQSTAWDEGATETRQVPGAAYLCDCAAWLPFVVGNVVDADDPDAVWNSEAAQEVRRSVLDGDFSYCSQTLCPLIVNDALPRRADVDAPRLRRIIDEHATALDDGPERLALGHDSTCNLACPSCRTGIIRADDDENLRLERARDRVILPLLRRGRVELHVAAWGDPFASKHYRSILEALGDEAYADVELSLLTNGQGLRPKVWETMPHLAERTVHLGVSVDAATRETYEDVRRPGRWDILRENLLVMGEVNRSHALGFAMAFVVQQANFREMPAFVRLAEEVGADAVLFQRYYSFGHEGAVAYAERDVSASGHPEHDELRAVLEDPAMRSPLVDPLFFKQLG